MTAAGSDTEGDRSVAEQPMADRRSLGRNYWLLWVSSAVSNFGDGVGIIAYAWLASTLTRNPLLIAGVAVASRLPWLLFTLPAGVLTDRYDRRRLVVSMDALRAVITFGVAVVVFATGGDLPDPDALADGSAAAPANGAVALAGLYIATLLLGSAEVLRDNSAQTLMPRLVAAEDLERANGRLWSVELMMNSFIGPPVAGFILATSLSVPFFIDATTFAVAALLLAGIQGAFAANARGSVAPSPAGERQPMRAEIGEGVRWLWSHDLIRSLAIALGIINGVMALSTATLVLLAQEVLSLDATGFGILTTSGAIGGLVGSLSGSKVSTRLGPGTALLATILVIGATALAVLLLPVFVVVFAATALSMFFGMVWNIITVALRQTLIPDELLGRVNSVYRMLGWGAMPIGTLLGGGIIALADVWLQRDDALLAPYGAGFVICVGCWVWARPRLNTAMIERAKAAG